MAADREPEKEEETQVAVNKRKREEEEDEEQEQEEEVLEEEEEKVEDDEASNVKRAKNQRRRKKVRVIRRTPMKLTDEDRALIEELKSSITIALLDHENISIPKSGIYEMIRRKLSAEGYTGGLDLNVFLGYVGDPLPEENGTFELYIFHGYPEDELPELKERSYEIHYGEPYIERPATGSKGDQKADIALKNVIDVSLEETSPSRKNFLLISNDRNYRGRLNMLREQGHVVMVADTDKESSVLKCVSHISWDWKEDFVPHSEEEKEEEVQVAGKKRKREQNEEEEAQVAVKKRKTEHVEEAQVAEEEKKKKRNKKKTAQRKRSKNKEKGTAEEEEEAWKPLEITDQDRALIDELKTRTTIALWNYEDIPFPKSGAYDMIRKKLSAEGYTGGLDLHVFLRYIGDPLPEENGTVDPCLFVGYPEDQLPVLKEKTYEIHYTEHTQRPASVSEGDQMTEVALKKFIDVSLTKTSHAPQNFLLISNDRSHGRMNRLRQQGNVVMLAHTYVESTVRRGVSHISWDWNKDFIPHSAKEEEIQVAVK